MPLLLYKQIDEDSAYAVWNIKESSLMLQKLSTEPFIVNLNYVRQAEWIIGRILVKYLCQKFGVSYNGFHKSESGKPFLNDSGAYISISHTFPIVVAMIHLKKSCGIDIDQPRKKHRSVKVKYLHTSEMEHQNDLQKLCIIWCAKEVVYKIFGRKFLSLKDEIKVSFLSDDLMEAEILKKGYEAVYTVSYERIKNYLLAYGVALS